METIKLAIADDERLFLDGLKTILAEDKDLTVLFSASDGAELLTGLEGSLPDIVLLDLRMKTQDGITTTQKLKKQYPDLKIIILSSYYRESFLGYMFKLGVNAFLPKDIHPGLLTKVIKQVYHKGLYFTEDQLKDLQEQMRTEKRGKATSPLEDHDLTMRETEILQLICQQYTNAEMAEKLFISIRTVEGHRNKLLLKTGVKNTVGLVLFALAHNLIHWDEKLLTYSIR